MNKHWMISALLFLGPPTTLLCQDDIIPLGGSQYFGSLSDCGGATGLMLTQNTPNFLGGGYRPESFDLNRGFAARLTLKFGNKDSLGGEGMVFVIFPDDLDIASIPLSPISGTLGYNPLIAPSFGIEFDTHYQPEYGDITQDHVALVKNGIHTYIPPLFGPVTIKHGRHCSGSSDNSCNDALLDVENGEPVNIVVGWDAVEQLIEVYVNDLLRICYKINLLDEVFNGNPKVKIGVFGATGEVFNRQAICLLAPRTDPVRNINNCNAVRNLRNWIQVNDPDYGAWIFPASSPNRVQMQNGNPTMLVSPIEFIDAEMEVDIRVNTQQDDDYIGIVWGLQQPFAQTYDHYEAWLLDWKKKSQTYCNGEIFAPEGLSIVSLNGAIAPECAGVASPYFYGHESTDFFNVLDSLWGAGHGWEAQKTYRFKVRYTSTRFDVWVINIQTQDTLWYFAQEGEFKPGRFGLYNLSQPNVTYSNFKYRWLPQFTPSSKEVCVGDTVYFSYQWPNSRLPTIVDNMYWDFGDGITQGAIQGDSIPVIYHVYDSAGLYAVHLWVKDPSSCMGSYSENIIVKPRPVFHIGNDTTLCPGETLYLVANFPNTTVTWQDGTTFPAFIVHESGNYEVEVVENGCASKDQIRVDYTDTIKYAAVIAPSCFESENGSVEIRILSGVPVVHGTLAAAQGFLHQGLAPGAYPLFFQDQNGCSLRDTVHVPEACEPSFQVEAIPLSCADWHDGQLVITAGDCPLSFTLNGSTFPGSGVFRELPAGVHTLHVEDSLGCHYQQSFQIESPLKFELITMQDTFIFLGQGIPLKALPINGNPAEVLWSPGASLSCSSCLAPIANPQQTQRYVVRMIDEKGCHAEGSVLVSVEKPPIFVPNAFSPNGDGMNDYFFPLTGRASPGVRLIHKLQIFSRGGNLVFELINFLPDEPAYGWDGTFKRRPLEPEVYTYLMEVEFADGKTELLKGTLKLLR
jgi:gliding motility-associated-like protein